MTWESIRHMCADILQKMISKPPTLCSTRAERRARDRWDEVMNMCETYIISMNLYDPGHVISALELAKMIANCIAIVDAVRRHEIDSHKSLEE